MRKLLSLLTTRSLTESFRSLPVLLAIAALWWHMLAAVLIPKGPVATP